MAKQRTHREWFRTVMAKRKSCPSCHAKLPQNEKIWSWGNYINARWHTINHVCVSCWPATEKRLVDHLSGCGCTFELVGYSSQKLPQWLKINQACGLANQ